MDISFFSPSHPLKIISLYIFIHERFCELFIHFYFLSTQYSNRVKICAHYTQTRTYTLVYYINSDRKIEMMILVYTTELYSAHAKYGAAKRRKKIINWELSENRINIRKYEIFILEEIFIFWMRIEKHACYFHFQHYSTILVWVSHLGTCIYFNSVCYIRAQTHPVNDPFRFNVPSNRIAWRKTKKIKWREITPKHIKGQRVRRLVIYNRN